MGSSNGIPRKQYYNKFNSPKENNTTNKNIVILTLKIKVAPNDFRAFSLKKYDDLFISLEKFFGLNKIEQVKLIYSNKNIREIKRYFL